MENQSIELRSEKVRNIIGKIPSSTVRLGSGIIFLVILLLLSGSYLFSFERTMAISIELQTTSTSKQIAYQAKIPTNKAKYIKNKQRLAIYLDNNHSIETYTAPIDSTIHFDGKEAYQFIKGTILDSNIYIDQKINTKATIYGEKINLITYLLNL